MESRELTPNERTFLLEYAQFRALAEADVMGVENPGIEFWLLGLLHLATINDYRLDLFATPGASWNDKHLTRSHVQAQLSKRGIDPARFASILRFILAHGAQSDSGLVEHYLDEDNLFPAILDDPTPAIAVALARLRLVTVLEAWHAHIQRQSGFHAKTMPKDLRHSILNPDLEALCTRGMLNPADPDDLDLIEYLYRDLDCTECGILIPVDRRRKSRKSYFRLRNLVRKEYDIDALERYALEGSNMELRAFSFCRLNGWYHFEMNDQNSRYGYDCGTVPDYPAERALRLCQRLRHELGPYPPYYSVHDVMGAQEVLREGAYKIFEQLRYGRPFGDETSYVGQLAREEAAERGVELEGIEFWMLGALRFAQLLEGDLYELEFPFLRFDSTATQAQRCRETLAAFDIDPRRFEPLLRGVLAEGAPSDPALLRSYMSATEHAARSVYFEPADLIEAVLRRPTQTLRLALMRLGLLMTLEERLPKELRNTPKIPYRQSLFREDHELESADLSNIDFMGVDSVDEMFMWCSNLRSVDLSPLGNTEITNIDNLFGFCRSLESVDLAPLQNLCITSMEGTFQRCESLTQLDLTPIDTSHVTNMTCLFDDCKRLCQLDISRLDTSQVTSMSYMFSKTESLHSIDLSRFDTRRVRSMWGMFEGCSALETLDLSTFDTSLVKEMQEMFGECSSLTELDLSPLDTSQVTDMKKMFIDCHGLTRLDVSGFDTARLENILGMFWRCKALEEIVGLEKLNLSRVKDVSYLFCQCESLKSIDLGDADLSRATNSRGAFDDCFSLASWRLPATWPLVWTSSLPAPTAPCGKWWAVDAQTWMDLDEIRERLRAGIVDTYTNEERQPDIGDTPLCQAT